MGRKPSEYCAKGHLKAGDNLYSYGRWVKDRWVVTNKCRFCSNSEKGKASRGYKRPARKTCRNGHTRTVENTRVFTHVRDGKQITVKRCIPCAEARQERIAAKRVGWGEIKQGADNG
jgi:hypothetical protein